MKSERGARKDLKCCTQNLGGWIWSFRICHCCDGVRSCFGDGLYLWSIRLGMGMFAMYLCILEVYDLCLGCMKSHR